MKYKCFFLLLSGALLWGGCLSTANHPPLPESPASESPTTIPSKITGTIRRATLPSGTITFDYYTPATNTPAPLILIAHGFQRNRSHMTFWGQHLAQQGFVAAVPDLPGWIDHTLNARVINELTAFLLANPESSPRIDPTRIGFVGHSAGGLATLMAAADNPSVKIWVGLDPVEFGGHGVAAAPKFHGQALILRAEFSAWNAFGNVRQIEAKLPPGWHEETIPHSIHIDPEWPTDLAAQLLIGHASDERRNQFFELTLQALKKNLAAH